MAMKSIQDLDAADILTSYNGKAGKCCCGCAGRYSYNPARMAEAAASRGYAVTPDKCSSRSIALALAKLKAAPADQIDIDPSGAYSSITAGARLTIIYPHGGLLIAQPLAAPANLIEQ